MMPIEISKDGEEIIIKVWHEGAEPEPPSGYRFLRPNEAVHPGDLAFNVIGKCWDPISEHLLLIASLFGKPAAQMFRFLPARIAAENNNGQRIDGPAGGSGGGTDV